ncbi:helix-turn-helix domain-containing protein [Planococcus lenghuensis]|uniref:HTH cro/C1-type domain-containing protein n=1 Tax=Planococcus lenghuensis TaxID=2213202 RepID=A0A1Q2L4N9_9BACL|nr:helix-turn-helix transcriptional regulator [Planococcus lenghuensis]AQQ55425.1 hypothetical protein B0X71_19865 [Planococcus lenghuensis]
MEIVSIGERIRILREQRNLSDGEFAKELGIAKSTVWAYEDGKKLLTVPHLIRIAEFLGVSADSLLGRSAHHIECDLQNKQGMSGYKLTVDDHPLNEEEVADMISYIQVKRRMGKQRELAKTEQGTPFGN